MLLYIAILFILTYCLIIAMPKYKVFITGISAIIASVSLLISKDISFYDIFNGIDYNVLMMLIGIMLTVGVFADSNMPNKMSEKLISGVSSSVFAIVILSVLSGFISAFVDNVATVLMLAPIGLAVAKKVGVSPIPVIISIAVSSNLQGAATLIGDTTSIMLASASNINFTEFFFLNGKPSIFWAVEIGAVATIPVFFIVFRKNNKKLDFCPEKVEITSIVPTIILLTNLLVLIIISFIQVDFKYINGVICMGFGLLSLAFHIFSFKPNVKEFILKSVDFQTVLFLFFLYILLIAVEKIGIILKISELFISIGKVNIFLLYSVIVWGSVLLSMFIDNIPYVATMLPVITSLTNGLNGVVSPYLLFFGLLIGATLGGNLTPIGASANVVGIGILNKEGYKVKNKDFFKIGIPFTLIAVTLGYLFIWFVWGM